MTHQGHEDSRARTIVTLGLALALALEPGTADAQVVEPQGDTRIAAPTWVAPVSVGEACESYGGRRSAAEWVQAAWSALAIPEGQVLHIHALDHTRQLIQSDRTYPPYLASGSGGQLWIDPVTGLTREAASNIYPGSGRWDRTRVRAYDRGATWMAGDSALVPVMAPHPFTRIARSLDPISVLADWRAEGDLRVAGICAYREDDRVVLERDGRWGPERLYLDRESALPVKTDRTEPSFLWGQVRAEVVWATWWNAASRSVSPYPLAATRLEDGGVVMDRTVGALAWIPRADAPVTDPPAVEPMDPGDPGVLESPEPDTVRVSDDTFLLVNRMYTEAATLQGDTVWLLDSTLGENRARQDHEWIRRVFGDEYPIVVVVTDLAWPHVAGVRYWVAQGAIIVSAAVSEPFLRRIVEREWTLRPDTLARRGRAPFQFRAVHDHLSLAGGRIHAHVIGGIGSEGALMVWLPDEGFVWAGDYIQQVDRPSTYAQEVWKAVRREGFVPDRFAAQHQELGSWSVIEDMFGR